MSREIVAKCISLGLLLGFVVLATGILIWLSELSRRFELSLSTSLVFGGTVLLILTLLASKLILAVDQHAG
jgi:hypothetical protein